jgi:DNA polymerase I-like protein with 3'-5' exonuclease and polymerase domains
LPEIKGFEKVGLDDFLNFCGISGAEKLTKLINRAKSSKELFEEFNKNKKKKTSSKTVESGPISLGSDLVLGESGGLSATQKVAELVSLYGDGVRGLISYAPTIEAPELLMDVVQTPTKALEFVGVHAGSIKRAAWIQLNGKLILPPSKTDLVGLAVILPEHPESYGTLSSLAREIETHLHKWLDISPLYEKIASYYVIFTWIFDKVNSLPYLRALGDTGTGKSRFLDVIGGICYRAIFSSGAITSAVLFRLQDLWKGTLIIDESDWASSDESQWIVKILNNGFEKRRPVIRCNPNDPSELEVFDCFGPKVLASRKMYEDAALESRCLTEIMASTSRDDIPSVLTSEFYKEQTALRNKLLMFRLLCRNNIDPDKRSSIDLGDIEPRLKQTNLSIALLLQEDSELLAEFSTFLVEYQTRLQGDRGESWEGQIIQTIIDLHFDKKDQGEKASRVYLQELLIKLQSSGLEKLSRQRLGQILSSLKIERQKDTTAQARYVVWDDTLFEKLAHRYGKEFPQTPKKGDPPEKPPSEDEEKPSKPSEPPPKASDSEPSKLQNSLAGDLDSENFQTSKLLGGRGGNSEENQENQEKSDIDVHLCTLDEEKILNPSLPPVKYGSLEGSIDTDIEKVPSKPQKVVWKSLANTDSIISAYKMSGGRGWSAPSSSERRPNSILCLDIESYGGLIPRRAQPRLISISGDYGKAILAPDTLYELVPLIEDPHTIVIGHNLSFDLGIIRAQAGRRLKYFNLWDTLLCQKLLYNGLFREYSLQATVKDLLGEDLDKSLQTSDWNSALTDAQLECAIKDALILEPVYATQRALLEQAGLLRTVQLEGSTLPAIIELEYNGILLNLTKAKETVENLTKDKIRLEQSLQEWASNKGWTPPVLKSTKAPQKFNPNSPKQLSSIIEFWFKHKPKNTSIEILKEISLEYPEDGLIKLLLQWKDVESRLRLLKQYVDKADEKERIHSSFNQLGAVSGRIISSKPNIQNIPPELKTLFVAPKGRVLVEADFSAIELRIAAVLAREDTLLQMFKAGSDPHKKTAQSIFSKEEISKEERQLGKTLNFACIYGVGSKGIIEKLPDLTEPEAREYIERFYSTYSNLKSWQYQISEGAPLEMVEGLAWKISRSALGRRRYINPYNRNDLLNNPVQSTGSDLQKLALSRLYQKLTDPKYASWKLVNAIHDSILLEAPTEEAGEASALLKEVMEQAGNEILQVIPCKVEVKVGSAWAFEDCGG